jgi:hypothetical protein
VAVLWCQGECFWVGQRAAVDAECSALMQGLAECSALMQRADHWQSESLRLMRSSPTDTAQSESLRRMRSSTRADTTQLTRHEDGIGWNGEMVDAAPPAQAANDDDAAACNATAAEARWLTWRRTAGRLWCERHGVRAHGSHSARTSSTAFVALCLCLCACYRWVRAAASACARSASARAATTSSHVGSAMPSATSSTTHAASGLQPHDGTRRGGGGSGCGSGRCCLNLGQMGALRPLSILAE